MRRHPFLPQPTLFYPAWLAVLLLAAAPAAAQICPADISGIDANRCATTCNVGDILTQGAAVVGCTAPGAVVTAPHTLLGTQHSDTSTAVPLRGAMIVGSSTPLWARVPIGGAVTFWRSDGTDPSWGAITLGTDTTGSYAAGDAEAGNATGVACADCVTLTTETAGNYVASVSTAGALTGGAAGSEGAAIALDLTTSPAAAATVVGTGRTLSTSGAALTGGGDLSADRTLTLSASPDSASVVGTGRTVSTSGAALSGGGDLSANRTITLSASPDSASVVGTGRTVSTTAPITGGGDLSANRTIAIADAAADGATKGAAAFTATDFDAAAGVISIDYTNGTAATGAAKGFLLAADWTTFNGKVAATRAINTTAPITGGGDLSANRTLAIDNFTGDAGAGGAKGAVPAPAAGDAAAGRYLAAGGGWSAPAGTGALTSEPYVTVGNTAGLSAERGIVAGAGLTGTDGGANSTWTTAVGAGTCMTINADDVALSASCSQTQIWTGSARWTERFALSAAQLLVTCAIVGIVPQDNWAIGNVTNIVVAWAAAGGASCVFDVTGIAGGTDGRIITILNTNDRAGAGTISLEHEHASSTAANRIVLPWHSSGGANTDITALQIPPGDSATLQYQTGLTGGNTDSTFSAGRWVVLAQAHGARTLAKAPTVCSVGSAPVGVTAAGNATGCQAFNRSGIYEINFGTNWTNAASATVTDANVTATSNVIAHSVAIVGTTGKGAEEMAIDALTCVATPAAGTFGLDCSPEYGLVKGKFSIAYTY